VFWKHAPQVPLTDRQRQQMATLGMKANRIDYGRLTEMSDRHTRVVVRPAGLDSRNIFWSPRWRYIHDTAVPKEETRGPAFSRQGSTPVVRIFLDAFPIGDSLAFNSATFLDVYETKLSVEPSKEFNAAVNMYFDLCELARREMMTELRAGPDDADFVNRTYDKRQAALDQLARRFFRKVRDGRDQKNMERYNQIIVNGLGINNLHLFNLYEYAW
jgi:hypothetical protein